MPTVHDDEVHFRGAVRMSGGFYPPTVNPTLKTSHWSADAADRLAATKLVSQRAHDYELAAPATAIAAATRLAHIVRGLTGYVAGIEAMISVASAGDKTASIDVQKSTAGGAFATILGTPIAITTATAVRTALAASIASTALVDGDILQIVVTVAGSTGTLTGLLVTMNLREDPE